LKEVGAKIIGLGQAEEMEISSYKSLIAAAEQLGDYASLRRHFAGRVRIW
jgi:ferritin-like metal-binding protein YciE